MITKEHLEERIDQLKKTNAEMNTSIVANIGAIQFAELLIRELEDPDNTMTFEEIQEGIERANGQEEVKISG